MLLDYTDGNEDNLYFLREFIFKHKRLLGDCSSCLDLAAGGALLLFQQVLIDIFTHIDICDFSKTMMEATFATEREIISKAKDYMKGRIRYRQQQEIKDVSL